MGDRNSVSFEAQFQALAALLYEGDLVIAFEINNLAEVSYSRSKGLNVASSMTNLLSPVVQIGLLTVRLVPIAVFQRRPGVMSSVAFEWYAF